MKKVDWIKCGENSGVERYLSNRWTCSDGDKVSIEIDNALKSVKIKCFSGIPASYILIDSLDFSGIGISENTFEDGCIKVAEGMLSSLKSILQLSESCDE